MPALGWVTNLRRMGKQLVADFRDVPRAIYDLIKRKAYNRVSAEVYWDYEDAGRKLPRVLKAVALLGAEIPAVTSLAALESLYDTSGKLRFHGGITASRGHAGDNRGRQAVVALARGETSDRAETPAFGCMLHGAKPPTAA